MAQKNIQIEKYKFKDVVKDILRGNSILLDAEGDIPCINPASIRTLELRKSGLKFTSKEYLPKGKLKSSSIDDVLINMIGTYRGKTAVVSEDFQGMTISRHVAIIKPDTKVVIPLYLAIALNSYDVQAQIAKKSSGAVIPSLNLKSFENIILAIHEIEEQKMICSQVVPLLNELSNIRARIPKLENEISEKLLSLGNI